MLDAVKYTEFFPDEKQQTETSSSKLSSSGYPIRPSLLVALAQLEREFSEILRAQGVEQSDGSQ